MGGPYLISWRPQWNKDWPSWKKKESVSKLPLDSTAVLPWVSSLLAYSANYQASLGTLTNALSDPFINPSIHLFIEENFIEIFVFHSYSPSRQPALYYNVKAEIVCPATWWSYYSGRMAKEAEALRRGFREMSQEHTQVPWEGTLPITSLLSLAGTGHIRCLMCPNESL